MKTRNRSAHRIGIALAVPVMTVVCGQPTHGVPPNRVIEGSFPQSVGLGEAYGSADVVPSSERITRAMSARQLVGPGTGADDCSGTTVVPVSVPGGVVINGDNSTVTGPDFCGFNLGTIWWESFEITQCADVVIDFCGTSPEFTPSWVFVTPDCPCASTYGAVAADRVTCGGPGVDENIWMYFSALPPGRYYYPILSNVTGPYQMTITTFECSGACCDYAGGTCSDGVLESNCVGATERFFGGLRCCEAECRDPAGPTYDALGVNLLSQVPLSSFPSGSSSANDVWGYVSPSGREYAIIGLSDGTGFVEVTNPAAPVVLADIPDASSIWSDMKAYGEHAYNVNETGGGMQIIDLTQIDSGIVSLVGSAVGGMNTAHNVALNPQSGYAYPCGTDIMQGFIAFDLSDPANPTPVGTWGNQYVHDLYVQSYDKCPWASRAGQPCEIAFAFCGGAGFYIIDVTNKAAMTTISSLTYPTIEYCHQGWITKDKRYIIMNDELDELYGAVSNTRTYVIDVQDLKSPVLVHEHNQTGCWIDHNLEVSNDNVYQAHYAAGLRVLDASDPLSLTEIAYFDTHPENNITDFVGAWGVHVLPSGVVLISDIERGLFVLDVKAKSQEHVKFSQVPKGLGEDVPSNIDWTDQAPNIVVADDWVSDGRPITGVRWWGSELSAVDSDGWLVSFHEPLVIGGSALPPLGLYYCDTTVVQQTATAIPACDAHSVIEYFANLTDCCLVHANPDSRSGLTPATKGAFLEENCAAYALDIQAIVGIRYEQDPNPPFECIEQTTPSSASDDFWGWHTSDNERGLEPGGQTLVTMVPPDPDWLYGPWGFVQPVCSQPNMAFELLTPDPQTTNPDNDDDGIPDACECTPSSPPVLAQLSKPSGTPAYKANRYLPVRLLDNDGVGRLIRVDAVQLPPPYQGTVFEGQQWWVGQPFRVCEKANEPGGMNCSMLSGQPKNRLFNWYAPLVCDQNLAVAIRIGTCQAGVCSGGFADGDLCGRDEDCQSLYFEHEGIVPSLSNRDAIYEVRLIAEDCVKSDPNNYSAPLTITQDRLGDLVGLGSQCQTPVGGNGSGSEDINAILKKFANGFCQVKKARCDITRVGGGAPDHKCDAADINAVLTGFTNPASLPWGPVDSNDACQQFGAAVSVEDEAARPRIAESKVLRGESSRDR